MTLQETYARLLETEAKLERQQECTLAILRKHGISTQCRKCGEVIYRLYSSKLDNTHDYNLDGMLHRHTCGKRKA